MKRRTTLFLAMATLSILALSSREAEAARFRLHLERGIAGFSHNANTTEESEDTDRVTTNSFYLLVPTSTRPTYTPMYNLGLGVEILSGLAIGSRIGLGFQRDAYSASGDLAYEMDVTVFSYNFMPYLEYAFGTGLVRPFLLVTLGLEGFVATIDDSKPVHFNAFAFGGGGGLRIVPAEMISIDLTIQAKGAFGKTKSEYTQTMSGEDMDETVTATSEQDLRGFSIDGILGLSLWL